MKAINLFAPVAGNTGYAVHGRNFAKSLNALTPLCLIPKYGPLPEDEAIYEMVSRLAEIDLKGISINLDFPQELYRFSGDIRIGYTVFETQVLAESTLHLLKQLHQVWVPSQWAKESLEKQNISSEKIKVIPEGIDPQIYQAGGTAFSEIQALDAFKFLTVGKWEERKGLKELLMAFDEAFHAQDKVLLLVYLNQEVQGLNHISPQQEIEKLNLKNKEKIILINNKLETEVQMAALYRSANAYVSASKAEGWGLPILEAMACGLPTLAPFYSAPTEYLNSKNSIPYEVKEFEDVYCPVFFPEKGEFGKWAKIDVLLLASKMREMFEQREEMKKIASFAAEEVKEKWTWEAAAKKAFGVLTSF